MENTQTKVAIATPLIDKIVETKNRKTFVVFSHYVKAEYEPRYKIWLNKIYELAKYFPGKNAIKVKRYASIFCFKYKILIYFDTYKNLHYWMTSPIRKEWFSLAKPLLEKVENPKISMIYKSSTFLPEAKKSTLSSTPARYKNTIVTWIGVYICASGLGVILTPVLAGLPYLVAQAIFTCLVVIILDYVFMPRLTSWFHEWLHKET